MDPPLLRRGSERRRVLKVPIGIVALLALVAGSAFAGGPQVVPCATFTPEPPPCATPAAPPAGAVALLDGEYLLLSDLEPSVREAVGKREATLADARRTAVKREVERLLVAAEATRRKVAARDLHYTELEAKQTAPTDSECQAEIDAHPAKYTGEPARVRARALANLTAERTEKLHDALIAKLSKETPVTFGPDPNTPSLAPDSVVATVGETKLTVRDLHDRLDTAAAREALFPWHRESAAVNAVIHERLAKREAGRRGITVEALTQTEVTAKIKPFSDADVARTMKELAYWFGADPEKARPRAVERLKQSRKKEAEDAFDTRLREGHAVKLLFEEPRLPAQKIETLGSPARGAPDGAVTLVEFGDFECPPCGFMSGVVEEALKGYEKRVRYVFRQDPLSFHPFAAKAGEASLAAHAQGRFFEYAAILFANQEALDVASLKRYANEAGLDRARFDRELDSGFYAAGMRQDARDAERHGVLGTPAFFLNGERLAGDAYSVEGMRAAFDRALGKAPATKER